MALARRVAQEMLDSEGREVGYRIRFESSRHAARNRIVFLTEGVMLRQVMKTTMIMEIMMLSGDVCGRWR